MEVASVICERMGHAMRRVRSNQAALTDKVLTFGEMINDMEGLIDCLQDMSVEMVFSLSGWCHY